MDGQEWRQEPPKKEGPVLEPLSLEEFGSRPVTEQDAGTFRQTAGPLITKGTVCKPIPPVSPAAGVPDLPAPPETAGTAVGSPPAAVDRPAAEIPVIAEHPAVVPMVIVEHPAAVPMVIAERPAVEPPVIAEHPGAESPIIAEHPAVESPIIAERPAAESPAIAENPAAGLPAAAELSAAAEPPARRAPPVKPLSNETVTGHTAAMWKYLPVPEDQPEPAPEYLQKNQSFSGGQVIAARVRGKKHKHEGTNCDDWFEAAGYRDLVFAAVSDGAGSKRFSRIGARESCRAAVGYLRCAFETLLANKPGLLADVTRDAGDSRCGAAYGEFAGVVQRAVLKAREAVETAWYTRMTDPAYEKVLGRPLALTDFSATLLVAAVIPAGYAGHIVVSCQVGDGMIALVNSKETFESAVKLMGEADSGEFSGETDFLTSAKMASLETLQNRTKLSRGHSDTLLMMTDGVADDYFPPQTRMRNLYFDLLANGVLSIRMGSLNGEQRRLYHQLPAPQKYPWVNDQSIQVPLHYTSRILESCGCRLEDLWANQAVLSMAGQVMEGEDPAERLQRWLDNYVERGSFDDRTLLAILM